MPNDRILYCLYMMLCCKDFLMSIILINKHTHTPTQSCVSDSVWMSSSRIIGFAFMFLHFLCFLNFPNQFDKHLITLICQSWVCCLPNISKTTTCLYEFQTVYSIECSYQQLLLISMNNCIIYGH